MSCLTDLETKEDYVTAPLADDYVHGDRLIQYLNDDIAAKINAIVAVINGIVGDDNLLLDDSVRMRMLARETQEAIGGYSYFWEVNAASTANLTLSGEQTVDDISLSDGDTILVKDQTIVTENGIYTVSTGTWTAETLGTDGTHHCQIEAGTDNARSSYVLNPDQSTTNWVALYVPVDQELDSDILAALVGTEGDPSATNLFVTDEDPRLATFEDEQDGLVPQPGVTATCTRFLCEDGTWADPTVGSATTGMYTDLTNTMDATGFIVFGTTRGIQGLADPTDDADACNKSYADDIFTDISALLSTHTSDTTNPHDTSFSNIDGFPGGTDFLRSDNSWVDLGLPTGDIVGTTDTQTLSAKTLATPTIADFTNATHDHQDDAGGGILAAPGITSFVNATHDHTDDAGGGILGSYGTWTPTVTYGTLLSSSGIYYKRQVSSGYSIVHVQGKLNFDNNVTSNPTILNNLPFEISSDLGSSPAFAFVTLTFASSIFGIGSDGTDNITFYEQGAAEVDVPDLSSKTLYFQFMYTTEE